jgi:2-polyprenyl-6-methoxyphenol hydroxylase-like FAD-dependent oxidoreductase
MTNSTSQQLGTRAVVLGGSIAGLLTARVLSDSYREVIVLDRDAFGPYGEYRKGVVQAQHAHGLLAGGLRSMEQLLPGLTDELVSRGAVPADLQDRAVWVNEGHALTRAPSGLTALAVSRLLLEDQIRRRVMAIRNVVVHQRCEAVGLRLETPSGSGGATGTARRRSWRPTSSSTHPGGARGRRRGSTPSGTGCRRSTRS